MLNSWSGGITDSSPCVESSWTRLNGLGGGRSQLSVLRGENWISNALYVALFFIAIKLLWPE